MPTASSAKRSAENRVAHLSQDWVPHLRDSFIVAKVGLAALLLAGLPLNAQRSISLSTGQTVTATITSLHLGRRRITLKRDNMVVRPTPPPTLKLIAELPGKAILLTDTYRSRPMGLSRCQAGEEQFLRVITLLPRPAETFHLKIASCRDNIELADDSLQWSPTTQTLTVHWLTPPASQPNPLTIPIAPDGRAILNP